MTATFHLSQSQVFPAGTSVGAYLRTAWPRPSSSVGPSGSAVATAVVADDTVGDATFSGLAYATRYYAAAQVSGSWRWVAFQTAAVNDPDVLQGEIDDLSVLVDGKVALVPSTSQTMQPTTDVVPLTIKRKAGGTQSYARIGQGTQYGAPPSAPSLATGGAGALTGTYKYAYTEADMSGQTPLSPIATYVASSEKIKVTLPPPRRGVSQRILYRTKAGGSTYYQISTTQADASGGKSYYQPDWIDNVADAALTTTTRSVGASDTTALYNFEAVSNGLLMFRLGADDPLSSDVGVLTSDAATAGSLAMDIYGQITTRIRLGTAYYSEVTGVAQGGSHILCNHIEDSNPDVSAQATATQVFRLSDVGAVTISPTTDGSTLLLKPLAGSVNSQLQIYPQGDTAARWAVDPTGKLSWAAQNTAVDATLYRSAANRLRVSSVLDIESVLNVGAGALGSSAANLQVTTTSTNNCILQVGTARGNFQIAVSGSTDQTTMRTTNGSPLYLGTSGVNWVKITPTGDTIIGGGAKATPAEAATGDNAGFAYMPSVNGTPTGTPAAVTGGVPFCIDRSGSKLWAYIGGAWKSVAVA